MAKDRKGKGGNELLMFIGTFLTVFVIVTAVLTPVVTAINTVSDVLDSTPGGTRDDTPILEEAIDSLISPDSPFFNAFTDSNKVNILLFGVDENNLTDTIMLACLDLDSKRVDLISIPRDTYYYRGAGYIGEAHHKINAVYMKNPVNTAKAVSDVLMNMPINYYVCVRYSGVAAIVDSMGGVPMEITFHMKYNDPLDTPPLHIDIPQGDHILSGEQSVQFLRYRSGYPDADLGRIKAQQRFMKSAFRQCLSLDLPKIINTAFSNVQSDMKVKTMLYLASKSVGMGGDDISTYTMPIKYVDYYVRPDTEGIAEMLTEIYMTAVDRANLKYYTPI